MSINAGSYFFFHLDGPGDPLPKPKPEWPPVEPTPKPPETEPAPQVPPVTSQHFLHYYVNLN